MRVLNLQDTTADEEIDWGDLENVSEVCNLFELILFLLSNIYIYCLCIQDIDYGISLEESGIVVENVQTDGSIARGNEALTLLDNFQTKNEFMNDILEVRHHTI